MAAMDACVPKRNRLQSRGRPKCLSTEALSEDGGATQYGASAARMLVPPVFWT